ncbi:hypothetical protein COCNU_07G014030 [Cocos nucifera]|uniref:Uncharacterized protein n=1 Tax=Cocos nucifera TaxID=13894 RepID=A0A8K0IFW7_COCNU|nr:hypothetical protein COCNU_07G014030 [Cocos nucifera]
MDRLRGEGYEGRGGGREIASEEYADESSWVDFEEENDEEKKGVKRKGKSRKEEDGKGGIPAMVEDKGSN